MILAGLLLLFVVYGVQKYLRRRLVKPDYTGQTIWITGASSGIGQYLCYEFNRAGANVIISARNQKELQRVKSTCSVPQKVEVVPLDLTDFVKVREVSQQVIAKLETQGRIIDVLIENAGISMRCEFKSYAFENHRQLFELNVHGPVNHIQACLEHMMKHKSGQIVGISSVSGKLATAYRSSYAGSKHAFIGILDSLRTQLKPSGISVCAVLPGYIRTNLSINALSSNPGEKFGSTDSNIAKGMAPQKFAKEAVAGIYLRQNEFQVSEQWSTTLASVFRNICPDAVFFMLLQNAKSQLRALNQAKKST